MSRLSSEQIMTWFMSRLPPGQTVNWVGALRRRSNSSSMHFVHMCSAHGGMDGQVCGACLVVWSLGRWGVDTCCSRMLAVLIACWQVSCMLARSLALLQSSAACRLQHDYRYYSPPPPPQPDDIIHVLTDLHIAHIGICNFRLDYTRFWTGLDKVFVLEIRRVMFVQGCLVAAQNNDMMYVTAFPITNNDMIYVTAFPTT